MRRSLSVSLVLGAVVYAVALVAVLAPGPTGAPDTADAIVVLGGGRGERVEAARELWEDEVAPTLLLSADAQAEGSGVGLRCDGESVVCVDPDPLTTAGEARTVAGMADAHGWEHVLVVTSRHHLRRARTLFEQCVDGEIEMVGRRADTDLFEIYRTAREAVGLVAAVTVDRAC